MGSCKYSCKTRSETLEWITAIVDFLEPFSFLMNAHVVNFFKDKLWEAVDQEWISRLRKEKPENLLLIPSGVVQEFPDVHMAPLNSVLSQGMNLKKKHEVQVLSSVVSSVVNSVGAHTVVDVGAGQGYLAQVLSFQYKHLVIAIDACSHHGNVTDARAMRIKKHFAAQMRKSGSGNKCPNVPVTVTCRVLSTEALKSLNDVPRNEEVDLNVTELDGNQRRSQDSNRSCSLVLAGLHACGDLSVTMLRTFVECKEVKAVVSVGCCYNLISEERIENSGSQCGFPMSSCLKSSGFSLGKNSRDLACQSAERWSSLGEDAGLQNFELHAFRAAFQMVLSKYYPEVMATSPSIGRQGKTLRRQQQRKVLESRSKADGVSSATRKDPVSGSSFDIDEPSWTGSSARETISDSDRSSSSFENFCMSAFSRLNLERPRDIDLQEVWKEAEAFTELIGPYWSIRAALGPVLETLILLDRLMFLQEQDDSIEAVMLPIFDPTISPRNVAIIAKKATLKTRRAFTTCG
ncbi:PREDICTED: methyltransferase-like protein 25 isoform X2 [Tarenaya hassleriana]|uniref:methyltransferase-like protein 25 isoform X2 n=1 Tax=Tarenaya hassleriana TaxID=28532 RepID=UPI00053C6008|nr:PREDICTED: methyltransferase-like protein 25 isoform X2 [Tarenaya hassleriana]